MTSIHHTLTFEKLSSKLPALGGAEKVICLLLLAHHFDRHSENHTALGYALEASSEADRLHLPDLLAESLIQIGTIHLSGMRYEQSVLSYTSALTFYEEASNLGGAAKCQFQLGENFWIRNHHEAALGHFAAARSLFAEVGDTRGLSRALKGLGAINCVLMQFDPALAYYLEVELMNKGDAPDILTAGLLLKIGNVLLELRRYAESLSYYQNALSLARELGAQNLQNEAFYGIGRIFFEEGNYPEASVWFESSLILSAEILDRVIEHRAASYLAWSRAAITKAATAEITNAAAIAVVPDNLSGLNKSLTVTV